MSLVKQVADGFDSYVDRWSVARIDAISGILRRIQPAGFWGDGEAQSRRLYLTFDDGPSPHTTPYLLEMLSETQTKATFFLIGKECEKYPELVEAIAAGGHSLGNHSYSHPYMPALSVREIEKQINKTNEIVREITGEAPELFRAPFGMMDGRTAQCLSENRQTAVYWTAAPEDWSNPGAQRVIRRLDPKIRGGAVIVLHEGKSLRTQTIEAAKHIIYCCGNRDLSLHRVESCSTLDRHWTTAL